MTMTNSPTIDGVSREKFERSVLTVNKHADIEKRKDGNYQNPHTQSAWWGFKEATALNSDLFEVAALQSTIAQLQARVAELEFAQPLDNPTAYLRNEGEPNNLVVCGFDHPAAFKVFRANPAPVAVVLPSSQELHILISKAARQADLTTGANYFTAAEFAAIAVIDATAALNGERK